MRYELIDEWQKQHEGGNSGTTGFKLTSTLESLPASTPYLSPLLSFLPNMMSAEQICCVNLSAHSRCVRLFKKKKKKRKGCWLHNTIWSEGDTHRPLIAATESRWRSVNQRHQQVRLLRPGRSSQPQEEAHIAPNGFLTTPTQQTQLLSFLLPPLGGKLSPGFLLQVVSGSSLLSPPPPVTERVAHKCLFGSAGPRRFFV